MTTQTEALKLALNALEIAADHYFTYHDGHENSKTTNAITAIKESLAQPEQEPVAWFWKQVYTDGYEWKHMADNQADADKFLPHQVIPLYTTPPQRTWVGLTDEEKQACIRHVDELGKYAPQSVADDERLLIEVVESKLMEKNNAA